jgi:PKD repeat protein
LQLCKRLNYCRTLLFSITILLSNYLLGQTCESTHAQFDTNLIIISCNTIIEFSDSSSLLETDSIISWLWDFGDGTRKSALQNPSHEYTSAGTFEVMLTIFSAKGCIDSIKKAISIPGPQPKFYYGNHIVDIGDTAEICQGEKVEVVNFSTGNPLTDPVFEMDWGDGWRSNTISIGNTLGHTYREPGTYELYLLMEDVFTGSNRCSRIFQDTNNNFLNKRKMVVVVHPTPSAFITASTNPTYIGHPTEYVADLDSPYTRIVWEMGDGVSYRENNRKNNSVIHKFQQEGLYQVVLAPEYDEIPRCWDRDTLEVKVLHDSLNSIPSHSEAIRIWPNPASSSIHIQTIGSMHIEKITVMDALGKTHFPSYKLEGSTASVVIGLLKHGNYVIRVQTNNSIITNKILVINER